MKNYGVKIILVIIFLIVSLFLTNDLGVIKIEKTALITAIAIDDNEGQMAVSAQIALPQATDTKTNSSSIVTGFGKTIGQAIDDIAVKTGWYAKLSFCNLVIINKSIADKVLPELINYSLYSKKMYDSILVAYSQDEAKKVLTATGSLDNISSFSLQKILLKNADNANAVYFSRIKDVAINITSKSSQNLIPLIKIEEDDFSQKTETGDSQKTSVFNATTTMLLNGGKIVGELNKQQTLFYNLIVKGVNEIYFEVPLSDNETVLLKIVDSQSKTKIKPQNDYVKLDLSLKLKTYLIDIKEDEIFQTDGSNVVPQEILEKAKLEVEKQIKSLLNKSFSTGCDFFEIKNTLYRYYPNFYKTAQDLDIKKTVTSVSVEVSSLDKN